MVIIVRDVLSGTSSALANVLGCEQVNSQCIVIIGEAHDHHANVNIKSLRSPHLSGKSGIFPYF